MGKRKRPNNEQRRRVELCVAVMKLTVEQAENLLDDHDQTDDELLLRYSAILNENAARLVE